MIFNIKGILKSQELKLLTAAELKNEAVVKSRITNPMRRFYFEKLEKALNEVFLKELNSKQPIFIRISPDVIKKVAKFLSGLSFRAAAIGVCGETASGKSTIVMDTMEVIENFSNEFLNSKNFITRINTDDYYYDRSKEVLKAGSFSQFAKLYDFDTPQAIELALMKEHIQKLLQNKEVYLPKYDMSGTAKRYDNYTKAMPSSVIIAEGLYALNNEICDIFDFKIYVHIDREVQKNRFFERAKQRNLGDSAEKIFDNAAKKAQIYVHPCAQNADIILNGEASRAEYKRFIYDMLKTVASTYNIFEV